MKIQVAKPFNLLLSANDKPMRFEAGEHEVDETIGNHWYTKQHLAQPAAEEAAPAEPPPPADGDGGAPARDPALMSDDELRAYIGEHDKTPHPKTGREKLLAKAGEIAASKAADAEAAAAAAAAAAAPEGEGEPQKAEPEADPAGGEGGGQKEPPPPADGDGGGEQQPQA